MCMLALIVFLGALALLGANTLLPAHPRWFEVALGVIVFALYFATLSRHVGAADTFEFQVVMPQWGIAHPTGYPLFVTLGKLFSLLPLGSMAFRLNVLSALIGTLAVWVIYRLIVRLIVTAQPHPPAPSPEIEKPISGEGEQEIGCRRRLRLCGWPRRACSGVKPSSSKCMR